MARVRLSRPAQLDIARILAISAQRWGMEGRRRYAAILAAAIRTVAANPQGPTTRARAELAPGLRSLHVRHASIHNPDAKLRRPVHILYYRAIAPELIEVVRVLHERMDPGRHPHDRFA